MFSMLLVLLKNVLFFTNINRVSEAFELSCISHLDTVEQQLKNTLQLAGLLPQKEVRTVDFIPSYIQIHTDSGKSFSLPTILLETILKYEVVKVSNGAQHLRRHVSIHIVLIQDPSPAACTYFIVESAVIF